MDDQRQIIEVGMAKMVISSAPNVLLTRGLGSCVGITIYDSIKKIGGLAHPMLPDIEKAKFQINPAKFVNSVSKLMFEEMKKRGCLKAVMKAKIFGGGHMFSAIPSDSMLNIGGKNIEMAKESLNSLGLKIVVEDTGGNFGRTIELDLSTGMVKVKTIFHGEKEV